VNWEHVEDSKQPCTSGFDDESVVAVVYGCGSHGVVLVIVCEFDFSFFLGGRISLPFGAFHPFRRNFSSKISI